MNVGTLNVQLSADTMAFRRHMKDARGALRGVGVSAASAAASMRGFGISMGLRVTAPLLIAATMAVRKLAAFDAEMRNVNTIAEMTEAQLAKTALSVKGLARALGTSSVDLARSLYNIESASFSGADGLKVLEAAAKAGRAGLSSTATAGRAITAVLNAYGKSSAEATDVSDIMFRTVKKGVLTFEDLASNLGTVIASASAAKVPFEQVAAALATMTRGGIEAPEAATSMNRFLMALIKPAKGLSAVFERLGDGSVYAAIQAKGFVYVLNEIQKATQGDAEALTRLGFELRSFRAASSLTRNEGKDYAKDLVDIADKTNRAGATTKAFQEQTKSLQFQFDKLKVTTEGLKNEFATALLPMLRDGIKSLTALTDRFRKMSPAAKEAIAKSLVFAAAIAPAAMISAVVLSSFSTLIRFLGLAAGGFRKAAVAAGVFNAATGMGGVAGGVSAAGGAAVSGATVGGVTRRMALRRAALISAGVSPAVATKALATAGSSALPSVGLSAAAGAGFVSRATRAGVSPVTAAAALAAGRTAGGPGLAAKTAAAQAAVLNVGKGAAPASRGLLAAQAALIGIGKLFAVTAALAAGYGLGRGINALSGGRMDATVAGWWRKAGVREKELTAAQLEQIEAGRQARIVRSTNYASPIGPTIPPEVASRLAAEKRMAGFGAGLEKIQTDKRHAPRQALDALLGSGDSRAHALLRTMEGGGGSGPVGAAERGSAEALTAFATPVKSEIAASNDWLEKVYEVLSEIKSDLAGEGAAAEPEVVAL